MNKYFERLKGCDNILDLGGGSGFMKQLSGYRGALNYKSVDNVVKYNPDILSDISNLTMIDNESVDGVICKAALEHCKEPHRVVSEIYRVLKSGGKAFVYVPFLYAYHGNKDYKDYFRFTRDGLEYLFRKFSVVEIESVRGRIETWLYLIPIKLVRKLSPLIRVIDRKSFNQASGFNVWIMK